MSPPAGVVVGLPNKTPLASSSAEAILGLEKKFQLKA